jgi:3',5'-cyclic AMP phosphodiesterase CpdA
VLHATDLHFLEHPTVLDVLSAPKRLIGCANLYLLGRSKRFSRSVQHRLVDTIAALKPDLLLLSGDLTCLALESEFVTARKALQPLLDNDGAFPTLILAGNHDAYTRGSVQQRLMQRYFGPWMQRMDLDDVEAWQWETSAQPAAFRQQVERVQRHFARFAPSELAELAATGARAAPPTASAAQPAPLSSVPVFDLGFLRLLCLDPCRPTAIGSRGLYPEEQLRQLQFLLQHAPTPLPDATAPWHEQQQNPSSPSSVIPAVPLPSSYNMLVSHYPLLDGQGGPYELAHKWHGAQNAQQLRDVLTQTTNLKARPHVYLHGHVHRGYADQMVLSSGSTDNGTGDDEAVPEPHQLLSFDPGSAGQAFNAHKQRCAAFNVYTITKGEAPQPSSAATASLSSSAAEPALPVAAAENGADVRSSRGAAPPMWSSFVPPAALAPGSPLTAALFSKPAESAGARGGVQTVVQRASDTATGVTSTSAGGGQATRYYVSTERFIYDVDDFRREIFPYAEGF